MSQPNPTQRPEDTLQGALESLLPIYVNAVHEWLAKQTPEKIQQEVFKTLDKAKDEVAPKLLGFERDTWDRGWRIDHCNGRSGESSLGKYLTEHQTEGIKQFFAQLNLDRIKPLNDKELAEIRKEYRYRVLDKVKDLIRNRAEADAARIVASMASTDFTATFLKAQELIGGAFQVPDNENQS